MTPSPAAKVASLAVMVAIWGTTWAAIRVSLNSIPPITGVALRFGLAGLLLWGFALALGLRGRRLLVPAWLWMAHGLLTFAVSYGLVYWAEQFLPTGLTAVIFATFPLFVAALAHFALPGERLRGLARLGPPLGFAGIVVLFSQDLARLGQGGGRPHLWSVGLIYLLAPLASAIDQVMVKRYGGGFHPTVLNAGAMVMAAGVMGLLSRLVESGRPVTFDRPAVGSLLYLAVCGTAVTFSLYFWLLRHMKATHLSLTAYAIPVVAVGVGALVFHEPITSTLVAGAALVVLGTAMASWRSPSPSGGAPAGSRPRAKPFPEKAS